MDTFRVWEVFKVGTLGLSPRLPADWMKSFPESLQKRLSELSPSLFNHLLNIGVGIEIEVERVKPLYDLSFWTRVRDPSLRGEDSAEYVTPFGFRIGSVFAPLIELKAAIDLCRESYKTNTLFNFSERTSVHVHLDCRLMTLDQLRSFVQLYLLFEDSLFNFAGPERKENIFCIPVRNNNRLGNSRQMESYVRNWGKYSAFNLRSISDKGTVEFRHMSGTDDITKIYHWVLLLGMLHSCAVKWSREQIRTELSNLKSSSLYDLFTDKVFGPFGELLVLFPDEMDVAVSEAKLLNEV